MYFSNPVKHIFTLSFVSGHVWVKDVPTHYFWISLGNLDANKILMGKWFTCAQHWVAQQPAFIGTSNNCTYTWNILQALNTKPLWANGHSTQGLYPSTKYFKRETFIDNWMTWQSTQPLSCQVGYEIWCPAQNLLQCHRQAKRII
jgi:S-methylmethionine-dependent homocysteine/selenocysteine methylase